MPAGGWGYKWSRTAHGCATDIPPPGKRARIITRQNYAKEVFDNESETCYRVAVASNNCAVIVSAQRTVARRKPVD